MSKDAHRVGESMGSAAFDVVERNVHGKDAGSDVAVGASVAAVPTVVLAIIGGASLAGVIGVGAIFAGIGGIIGWAVGDEKREAQQKEELDTKK